MKIKNLVEEFKTGLKKSGEYFEIYWIKGDGKFKYDDLKAMKTWKYGVRFALDLSNDCLYAWNASLLHEYASKELGLEYTDSSVVDSYVIWGEATLEGSTLNYNSSAILSHIVDEAPRRDDYYKLLLKFSEKLKSSRVALNISILRMGLENRIKRVEAQRDKIAEYEKAYKEREE